MESSSKESAAKVVRLGKRKPEADLETKPFLRKHKETSEEKETTEGFACSLEQQDNLISAKAVSVTLFVSELSRQTKISDIIDFFSDVGEVVNVRICLSHTGSCCVLALLSFLLLVRQTRHWKRRMVNICTIKRFLLKLLRQVHTVQSSFASSTRFGTKTPFN
uniref:Polyadenylate-binding protein n=1 Tax=Arabidopsis thaliana TaxID=3702 RepID=Q1PFN2_ARATH|nr:polyadenylate-binding protein [Arabidopsis thaliana]